MVDWLLGESTIDYLGEDEWRVIVFFVVVVVVSAAFVLVAGSCRVQCVFE